MQRSVQKKRLGERPAEDQEKPTQKQSEASSGEKTWGERDKQQAEVAMSDLCLGLDVENPTMLNRLDPRLSNPP